MLRSMVVTLVTSTPLKGFHTPETRRPIRVNLEIDLGLASWRQDLIARRESCSDTGVECAGLGRHLSTRMRAK